MKLAIRNDSSRPNAEVEEIVRFAVAHTGAIERSLYVRVREGDGRASGGSAGSRLLGHRIPKLAGRATHYVSAEASRAPDDYWPRVQFCGHAKANGLLSRDDTAALYAAGARRVGRWPLVRVCGWREDLLHTLAHEMWHVLQYDRERMSFSEVDCEVHAERVLAAWQLEKRGGGAVQGAAAAGGAVGG